MSATSGPPELSAILNVVTFLWSKPGYRSKFTEAHVTTLYDMIARNYRGDFKLHCFNDLPEYNKGQHWTTDMGERALYWRPLWTDHADVPHPMGAHNPSCFRRLRLYSQWARENIGDRIVQLDLDMVLTGDVTPLWDRCEDFVFWADQLNRHGRINGAMQLITPGMRDEIWSAFNPERALRVGKLPGQWGSDQGWLAASFPEGTYGTWGAADGCYSWRVHVKPTGQLPAGARIVNFHGAEDPWTLTDRVPWIKEHYR